MRCFQLGRTLLDNVLVEEISSWDNKVKEGLSRHWEGHSRYRVRQVVIKGGSWEEGIGDTRSIEEKGVFWEGDKSE